MNYSALIFRCLYKEYSDSIAIAAMVSLSGPSTRGWGPIGGIVEFPSNRFGIFDYKTSAT